VPPACDLIHFRPIIRHHTDVTLGHCSYLNTCYSEPTYSLSPSIPPPPSSASHPRSAPGTFGHAGAPNANSPASLPSGLGAGGRGKEKAPCRYLHFEVDWDEADENQATAAAASAYKKINAKKEPKKPVKLGIGQGPSGKITELVRTACRSPPNIILFPRQIPPQWINCDVRRFDYSVLGKFHVIMADPPWDIHMSVRPSLLIRDSLLTPTLAPVWYHDRR
jgi:mRNA (2'-O-methyladenosine-N6-)-methyltransferase